MRPHSQPLSKAGNGYAMSNVAKLQKALEAAENMTEAEYENLHKVAKMLDYQGTIIIDWDGHIAHREYVKKLLEEYAQRP